MACQRSPQDRQLLPRLQPPEALYRFDHARSGPAQGHACIAPIAWTFAADTADRAVHVLDDVGAGERSAELLWQAQARDREDFIEPFENAGRHTRRLAFQAAPPGSSSIARLAPPSSISQA